MFFQDEPSVSTRQRSSTETSTFSYLTPTVASTPNRRKLLGATNHMATPYSFAGYNTDMSSRPTQSDAIVTHTDDTTDEELEDDAEQSTANTQQSNNRKQLYIAPLPVSSRYGSVQRSYTADSLQKSAVGKHRYSTARLGEDNDDDFDNDLELNGMANESASESGDSSTAILRASIKRPQSTAGRYSTSIIPEERIESQRTLGGLYSSVAENRSKRSRNMTPDTTAGLSFTTHLQTHKSLFSDKNMPNSLNNSTTSLTSLNRRQSFNPSIYGSTSALSDSRLLNTNSPFYNGRTMYGGASAYSRRAVSAQRTLRVPTQIRPQSSLSSSTSTNSLAAAGASNSEQPTSALSSTAKRILDLMEQFKSPLADAKKMARNGHAPELAVHVPAHVARQKRFDDSDIMMNRSIRLSSPKTPYSRNIGNGSSKRSPPMIANELQVPSMSQLLQMKKVLQNNTEKVRQLASGSQSILNTEAEYKLPNVDNNANDKNDSSKRKMRNKINSTRPSTKQSSNDARAEEANLPNIQLNLGKSVPVLDNALSKPATSVNVNKQISNTAFNTIASNTVSEKTKLSCPIAAAATTLFKFTTPVEIATPSFAKNVEPINNFTFSDPLLNNIKTSSSTSILATASQTNAKERNQSLSQKPIPQLKTGSVLDALKTKSTDVVSSPLAAVSMLPPLSAIFKPKVDQWECSSCMLRNDKSKTKCVSCESPSPASAKPISASISLPLITNSFGNQFKPSSGTWECDGCMLQNKSTASKCVACETPKPQSNKTPKPLQNFNSFGNQFKPSAGTWECDACMVQNKSDATKCVSCTTAKPGVALTPKNTSYCQGYQNLVAMQNSKWSCSACMVQNDVLRKKCECCDMERPGLAADGDAVSFSFGSKPAATFSFGVPFNEKSTAEPVKILMPSTSSASSIKPTFSFGVPKPASSDVVEPTKPTFSFGAPAGANSTTTIASKKDDAGMLL